MQLNLKLRAKLLIVVISGLLIVFSFFAAFRIYQAKTTFTAELNRSGSERVKLIAESLANMIIAYDYSNMELIADRLVNLQDVEKIRILNRAGKVMVTRTSPTIDPSDEAIIFSSPVTFLGETIGQIEMELSLNRMNKDIALTYRNILIAIALFAIFLGGLIYTTVSILIIKPLSQLSNAANQLADGDFLAALPRQSKDELGLLVSAFTAMRNSRKKTEIELNNLNASLETIVMQRIAELKDSEAYTQAVLENVNEGIIVNDQNGIIMSFNAAAEKIFAYNSEDIINKNFNLLVSQDNLSLSGKYHKYNEDHGNAINFGVSREAIGLRKDFSAFPLELKTSQLRIKDQIVFISTARDISERKDAEQRITYIASHDALTKLPNRTLLQDRIQQTLVHNARRNIKAAVIFIDLDKFKIINDTLGHDVGDLLLQETSTRLLKEVRNEDTVARQGGDEFIILLSNITHAQDAAGIAQKLLDSLLKPFYIAGKELHISASIGIAIFPDDGNNMETLLKNSDVAMYHAKETGRNNYQYFSPSMNEQAAEKQMLSSNLRHAIEMKQLSLVYQPVIEINSGKMTDMEVLIRWLHPTLGLISPSKFIPLAEETGCILEIGEWVFKTACQQLSEWKKQGFETPRLAINLSAKQFRQKELTNKIAKFLSDAELPCSCIGIEITESMLVHNIDEVVDTLRQLSSMGLEISIDDFGTGYSSLSYLKRFPINKLKIDKSFIDDIATNPDDAAIVIAIIAMAHGLQMTVVSEGVETQAQLDFLQQHNCQQYQGYLYSKPLTALEVSDKLQHTSAS